ncbi:MAG: hypothetical protein ACD_75C00174G0003 [uncultured bacterium]|nr:MAG: hypothetical protein ACD_75C00174G0003 [uncultured bacterium]
MRGISINSSQPHSPLFATEKLTVEGGAFDLGARSIAFDRIAMSEGRFDAGLDGDGKINWLQLFQPKKAADESMKSEPAPDVVPAWKFLVNSFEVEKFSSKFSDLTTHSPKPIFGLQDLNARLTEVGGKSPVGFTVGFQGELGGVAAASGTIYPAIPSVQADVNVSGMVLTSLQPYIDSVAALQLQSASVSGRGQLSYGTPKNAQEMAYTGSLSLDNLRLIESASQIPYLSWDAAQLPEFKLTLQPNRLDAREIKISGPAGKLIIGEDGNPNLAGILKSRPDNTESKSFPQPAPEIAGAKERNEAFAYNISRVEVKNAEMVFEDLSLRPGFMTRIHDLEGTVTGLSSEHDAQAKIRMDGAVDRYGIAKISGAIRPSDFQRSSGDLIGGESANLDLLEFDPGSAGLLPPEQEKLLKLADALQSRPQLKLVVQGRYSPEIDGLECKERSVRGIVAARPGEEPDSNDAPEPLDFTDSDTQNTLEKVDEERFGKASLDELEQGDCLLQLAENRAQAIVAYLEDEAQIPKDHVSIKAPAPLPGDERPSVSLTLEVY